MNLGDAFLSVATAHYPSHLWFVVSHPDGAGRVVIVNISSDDAGLDDLPTLAIGAHPWIQHESFIRADMAMLAPVTAIEAALTGRPAAAIAQAPSPAATLTKLQRALLDSKHTRREIKRTLQEQGFP